MTSPFTGNKLKQAIDLFTDTAAILNYTDLRSIMGCPVSMSVYLHALFGPIFFLSSPTKLFIC